MNLEQQSSMRIEIPSNSASTQLTAIQRYLLDELVLGCKFFKHMLHKKCTSVKVSAFCDFTSYTRSSKGCKKKCLEQVHKRAESSCMPLSTSMNRWFAYKLERALSNTDKNVYCNSSLSALHFAHSHSFRFEMWYLPACGRGAPQRQGGKLHALQVNGVCFGWDGITPHTMHAGKSHSMQRQRA